MLQSVLVALAALLAAVLLYSNVSIPWQKWVITCKRFMGGSPHQKSPITATSISANGKDISGSVAELSRTATPLAGFDLGLTEPIPYRPFLSQGHYSIGLKKIPKEDWIQIDNVYPTRIADRKRNLSLYPQKCHAINNEEGALAIRELFEEIITHLPARFPTIFSHEATDTDNSFRNIVTGESYEIEKTRTEPRLMLKFLSENVEEDFYLMCPDQNGVYVQQGFLSCFSNGFLAPMKLGLSMRDIHAPVPGLEEKIGKSIDRFMGSMRAGSMVQRMGWSLQFSGSDLLRTGGNNFYPDPDQRFSDLSEPQDVGQCYLRVERQTLTKLPESGAIVFGIHHYVTSLEQVRKEGHGEKLAEEIRSMPEKLGYYKRRPFWQRDISAFLTEG